MTKKTIAKKDINAFVEQLLRDYTVYAPAREANYVTFRQVASPEEVVWDCLVTRKPPKDLFFPQTETLFVYAETADGLQVQPPEGVKRDRILWGIRPCDLQALSVQDSVFDTKDASDTYFMDKRRNTTLVGIGCNQPLSTCFCTSVGGGPFKKEGTDLFLTDIGDAYLAEAFTPKGKLLLGKGSFKVATKADLKAAEDAEAAALKRLPTPIDLEATKQHLDKMIDSPFWDEVQATCIGCGVCTFLCPVCHCFDIVDEGTASCGVRVRNWDTCQYCIYSLEASGHNPRPTQRERVRQRLMHKFNYELANQNVVGCVGCGRCVQLCPVNLDIRQILGGIGAAK
ncbi:MAG TPA: 4Fe-4S dicluster domain-containing protein [Anaerolineae bacterium]|nr:4Fe-4S dicluster domain-containing protein [Anaerolineae bacterium]HQJ50527.1 4Fe-4S dicluster domain-containing protein [Anaerolineae bacterium]